MTLSHGVKFWKLCPDVERTIYCYISDYTKGQALWSLNHLQQMIFLTYAHSLLNLQKQSVHVCYHINNVMSLSSCSISYHRRLLLISSVITDFLSGSETLHSIQMWLPRSFTLSFHLLRCQCLKSSQTLLPSSLLLVFLSTQTFPCFPSSLGVTSSLCQGGRGRWFALLCKYCCRYLEVWKEFVV